MIKHILIIFFIALAFSQFTVPDLGQIGETIKNEAVKA